MRRITTIALLAGLVLAIIGARDPYEADKLLDKIGAAFASIIRAG